MPPPDFTHDTKQLYDYVTMSWTYIDEEKCLRHPTIPAWTTPLGPDEASDAVAELGWRYVDGALATVVPVRSLDQGAEVVSLSSL